MTRVLSFPAQSAGRGFLVGPGKAEQFDAAGDVDVPDGDLVALDLDDTAPADLSFLDGVDPVLIAAQLRQLDAAGVARLATQPTMQQLVVKSPLTDQMLGLLTMCVTLVMVEVTLADPAGPGLTAVASGSVQYLTLHGNPGDSLAAMSGMKRLAFYLDRLSADALTPLKGSSLESLTIRVDEAASTLDGDVIEALREATPACTSLNVVTPDGTSALPMNVVLALLDVNPELEINRVTYTPAARARLEEKLARA